MRRSLPLWLDNATSSRLGLVLGLLAACTSPESEPEDFAATLSAPGMYRTGYVELDTTYTDPYGAERTLPLSVWFPTNAVDGDDFRYRDLFNADGVFSDVDIADGPFPLIVYSHGHRSYAQASGRVVSHLASHGFVVVSPDHMGNLFTDGDRTTPIYTQRPADLSASLDAVITNPDLSASVDPERVLAMGHSFGGYSAFALAGATYDVDGTTPACLDGRDTSEFCTGMVDADVDRLREGFTDDRIDAVMAMAPGDWRLFKDGLADINVPTLHMTGDIDPSGSGNEPIWDSLDGPDATRVDIINGGHLTFTDLSGSSIDPNAVVPQEQGDPIVFAYTLAFARRWTGEQALGPVLAGEVLNMDGITLSSKP